MKLSKYTLGGALAATLAFAPVPGPAQSSTVQVLLTLPFTTVQCVASDTAWSIGSPATFAWRCNGAAARFRCTLTSAGHFNLATRLVTGTCNVLTELPPGNVNGLIVASGMESVVGQ
jgi:hypothetical protein